MENPQGFRLLREPLDFFITRAQCAAELLLFFGPYLAVLFVRSVRQAPWRRSGLCLAAGLAIASLFLMFAAGTFRLAETARICNFIYPFLLIPIALYLQRRGTTVAEKKQLCLLVFSQTIVMQMAGSYFW